MTGRTCASASNILDVLTLKDGSAGLGIVPSETNEDLVLTLPGGTTQKFRKDDVAKRDKPTTSLIPSGLSQSLTQYDLVNLADYLASLKAKPRDCIAGSSG